MAACVVTLQTIESFCILDTRNLNSFSMGIRTFKIGELLSTAQETSMGCFYFLEAEEKSI